MSHTRCLFLVGLCLWATIAESRRAMSQETAPTVSEPASDPFAEEDSFLLREPENLEELLRAAIQAQRLARPNLSRLYLQRFLDLNPTDEQLLELRDEFGPAAFARLANQPELQPLSVQLADRVTRVFRERGASAERVSALIEALDGPPAEAFAARETLVNAGEAVIPQVVLALRNDANENIRQQLLDVLVGMGGEALPAVHAALNAPDDRTRIQMITVIGEIADRSSIPYLYTFAFGPSQPVAVRTAARMALADVARLSQTATNSVNPTNASEQLSKATRELLQNSQVSTTTEDSPENRPEIWFWDGNAGTVSRSSVSSREASLYKAATFAREAFLLAPDRADARSLYLAVLLELESLKAGVFEPPTGPGTAYNLTLEGGSKLASAVLQQALSLSLDRAAIGALGVLAQTASPAILLDDDSVLLESLRSSNSRVQLASAVAVLRLNPRNPFPESNRIVEILARALSSEAEATAIIIDPNPARGANLAGFVRQMGFNVLVGTTGQEGFRLATEQVTPVMILVNLNVSRWPLSQTLANFRADARTREVPVIVVGPATGEWQAASIDNGTYRYFRAGETNDPQTSVRRVLADVADSAYVVETTTAAAFAMQVRPFLAQTSQEPLSDVERQNARVLAAYWLAQIADTGRTDVFPLQAAEPALVSALSDEDLAENAVIALGAIPTRTAQMAIANHLLAPTVADSGKNLAAEVLLAHVTGFGLLLDNPTLRALAQLRSGTTDPRLATTLAAFEGAVTPSAAAIEQELSERLVPLPAAPAE